MGELVRILCVDDEAAILKALRRLFMDHEYEILTASSGDEGLAILTRASDVQVVVSDYRMPGMNGVDFLHEVCRRWPETVRIVLSGYADTASVVSAINEGEIYKFIPKPWNDDELKVTIANAVERYFLHKRNIELTDELKEMNEELQTINDNLEKLVEERTSEIVFHNLALQKSQNILDALPMAVVGLDPDGIIVWHNKTSSVLFGDAVLGTDRSDAFSDVMNAFIERVIEHGAHMDMITLKDRPHMARGVVMDHEDGQRGILLILCDEKT